MRNLLTPLLISFATQVGAGQFNTTVSALMSDAYVNRAQQKSTQQIVGTERQKITALNKKCLTVIKHLQQIVPLF